MPSSPSLAPTAFDNARPDHSEARSTGPQYVSPLACRGGASPHGERNQSHSLSGIDQDREAGRCGAVAPRQQRREISGVRVVHEGGTRVYPAQRSVLPLFALPDSGWTTMLPSEE